MAHQHLRQTFCIRGADSRAPTALGLAAFRRPVSRTQSAPEPRGDREVRGDGEGDSGEGRSARVEDGPPALYTIGHSTRTIEQFIALLRENGVELLVDVRRFPGSRRHPQFGIASLAASLAAEGIGYAHAEPLGGRRGGDADPSSPNTAWRNAAFRAYADYMATPPFRAALDRLIALSRERPTVIMCAEAVPWRCHRR